MLKNPSIVHSYPVKVDKSIIKFTIGLANRYHIKTQISQVLSEDWLARNIR